MGAYLGNTNIGQMFIGSTEIGQAYLGSKKVWEKGGVTPPQPSLPYDAEIEYLESDGNAYINTGVSTKDIKVGIDATLSVPSQPSENYKYFLGAEVWNSNATRDGFTVYYSANYLVVTVYDNNGTRVAYGNTTYTSSYLRFVINCLDTGISFDGVQKSATQTSFGSLGRDIYLFKRNFNISSSNGVDTSRIKEAKIYKDNNVLIRHFIPVRVGNTGYMYDKVSGQLFGNNGTGNFTLGNDITT